ncbi:MAG: DegV family protein [Oscillospiraceae bacterium]|nr:DegV family protein [Oscillospiraceae bacterium]
MIKFIICSDSDIPLHDIKKHDIDLLPLIVELDGVEYRAYRDISGEDFRTLLKNTKSFPKTATVSFAEIADKMRVHIENGDEVIMIAMSSKESGTFNVARLAKKQFDDEYGYELPISVVDSLNFTLFDARNIVTKQSSQRNNGIVTP